MIFLRNATIADATIIRDIAYNTWPKAYGEILSSTQLEYMLRKMYSIEELERQLTGNILFLIAEDNFQKAVGFAAYSLQNEHTAPFHLHKLYVLPEFQKHHCGRMLLEQVMQTVREMKGQRLSLNVNRYNQSRFFYERMGFNIIREEDIDIGNGYYMNDYVMEKKL